MEWITSKEIKKYVKKMKYPAHCIHCEGIDERVENPQHHPSYEITPLCNLRCIFCYSRIAQLKGNSPRPGYYGDLDPKAITISQYGEPFVAGNRKVVEIIKKLREIFGEVRIDIQTNGTLINAEEVGSEADIIMISLDASSRERYVDITGADMLDVVLKNISRSTEYTTTVVRTVFMPGLNDSELEGIAEIAGIADELFLQPLSIYRENKELLSRIDVGRAESIGEFLKAAYNLSEIANVVIPGCILLNIRILLKDYDMEEIMLMRRNAFGSVPVISRKWRFEL
jgi:MoaA/NifB/PqqE/SkfB family radical SAM enzyme